MKSVVRVAVLCLFGALATGCSVSTDHPDTGGTDGVVTNSGSSSNQTNSTTFSSQPAATDGVPSHATANACDVAGAWSARSNFAFDAEGLDAVAANLNPLLQNSDRPAMTISSHVEADCQWMVAFSAQDQFGSAHQASSCSNVHPHVSPSGGALDGSSAAARLASPRGRGENRKSGSRSPTSPVRPTTTTLNVRASQPSKDAP